MDGHLPRSFGFREKEKKGLDGGASQYIRLLFFDHYRQGSWKTGEKEAGTTEEIKRLEENRPDE